MLFTLAHGSVPPMVTPMTEDAASIDRDGIAALVEWHIEAGTTGLFVVCSTGEMFALSQDEMVEIVEAAVISADGRIPIIAGLPFPDVNRKAEIAKRYETVGVDGGVALQPFESPADNDTMYEHYARLADEVNSSFNACTGWQVGCQWTVLWDEGLHGRSVTPGGYGRRERRAVWGDASRSGTIASITGVRSNRSLCNS